MERVGGRLRAMAVDVMMVSLKYDPAFLLFEDRIWEMTDIKLKRGFFSWDVFLHYQYRKIWGMFGFGLKNKKQEAKKKLVWL